MVRVLAAGMHELGLTLPVAALPKHGSATVKLDLKRSIVEAAVEQAGLACLPRLGHGLKRMAQDPTHRALTAVPDPSHVFARWLRLERYVHSRHRSRVLEVSAHGAVLEHFSLGKAPPLPAEDLVVVGVLAALLETIGVLGLRVRAGDAPVYPEADTTAVLAAARAQATAVWTFSWAEVRTRSVRRGLHPHVQADVGWPQQACDAFAVLAADLITPPPVKSLAAVLKTSSRTLQRALSSHALSYSVLLAEARCRTSAAHLLHAPTPIAEIGFICGYSDQPHFTREFRARVGMTPARYRREFGSTA